MQAAVLAGATDEERAKVIAAFNIALKARTQAERGRQ